MTKTLDAYVKKVSKTPLWRMNKLMILQTLTEICEAATKEEDDLLRDELRIPYWKLVYAFANKNRFNVYSTNEKQRPVTVDEEKRLELIRGLREIHEKKEKRYQKSKKEKEEKKAIVDEGTEEMQKLVDRVMEEIDEEDESHKQSSEDSVKFNSDSSSIEMSIITPSKEDILYPSQEEKKAKACKPKKSD